MFVNLHRHSQWSILDGTGTGEQYAERAVALGQPVLALTDHETLAGALEHYDACKKHDVFPVMGCEVYFRDNRLDHSSVPTQVLQANGKYKTVNKQPKRFHLTLLAMNWKGWLNLQKLTSEAYQSGFYYRACVDFELLARYSEGIYCLGGCIGSRFSAFVQVGHEPDVVNYINTMRSIFRENFSLEIMPHDFDDQRMLNLATLRIGNEFGIPLAATGDSHAPSREWTNTRDISFRIGLRTPNKKLAEMLAAKQQFDDEGIGEDIKIYTTPDVDTLHLMGDVEMFEKFAKYHPSLPRDVVVKAMNHTGEIVSKFDPFMISREIKMPKLTKGIIAKIDEWDEISQLTEASFDPEWAEREADELVKKTLRRWAYDGLEDLKKLYPESHWFKYPVSRYEEQIEHELDTFDKVGDHVWRYMLVLGGEVRWAKRDGIVVGPGRGSAAGSVIAYLIGITEIDPISYGLMFERFINVNRKGMPDIDVDFMPGKRGKDRVVEHTKGVYGEKNVVPIAAYGTYGPKSAIRAVCRIFDDTIAHNEADRYAKVLDVLKPTDKIDLEECAIRFAEIAEFKNKYPVIWVHATRLEGHPYTASEHASGVIIKPPNVEIPLATRDVDGERKLVTAWPDTKELLAGYGFLKADYLVINGLVRQFEIMEALRVRENTPVNLRELPVRWDPYAVESEVMQAFSKGSTLGIWQFEGRGTIPVLKAVRPDNMHDVAAINALIRPGPRAEGTTDLYAKIKHGIEPLTYWHDAVEPALKHTYGLMIYQEQAMEISVQLGGFSRTEADDLRKAMGKKYREGMAAVKKFLRGEDPKQPINYEAKFIHNASKLVGEENAHMIWDKVLAFGGYSFNASHAYAYGLISYHDGLLKSLAPADFYAWYLTFTKSTELSQKLGSVMREGARYDIKIVPPDINRSGYGFSVIDKQHILYGIESVKGVGPAGVKAIFDHRPYKSYTEFTDKVPPRLCNKNAKAALVAVGAFDEFGLRQFMSEEEKASNEMAYIGLRLSGRSDVKKYGELIEEAIHTEDEFDAAPDKEWMSVGGEIIDIKPTTVKNGPNIGAPMGFITCAFGDDSYRVTVFNDKWEQWYTEFKLGRVVFFDGLKDISEKHGAGFIAKEFTTIEALLEQRGLVSA